MDTQEFRHYIAHLIYSLMFSKTYLKRCKIICVCSIFLCCAGNLKSNRLFENVKITVNSDSNEVTCKHSVLTVIAKIENGNLHKIPYLKSSIGPNVGANTFRCKILFEDGTEYFFINNFFDDRKPRLRKDYVYLEGKSKDSVNLSIDFKKLFATLKDRNIENTNYGTYKLYIDYLDRKPKYSNALSNVKCSNELIVNYTKNTDECQ